MDFQTQLDTLDEQLEPYSPSTRWFLYIAGALGILLMGWMFYLSDALDELSAIEDQNAQLTRQISESSPQAYERRIAQTTASLKKAELQTASLKTQKEDVLTQMKMSEGLIFDNRQYAEMLDRLLERSVSLGLHLESMESVDSNATYYGKISRFKQLSIRGNGRFPAIAEFLSSIESQKVLVQIDSVRIATDGAKPRFDANISYMGVTP